MSEYTYQVTRTADGKYLAMCIGFSRLCYIADTEAEAMEGIKRLVMAEAQQKSASGF